MMGGTGSHGQDHSVYQHLQAVQVRCELQNNILSYLSQTMHGNWVK
jgi:hypothetical protein